MDKIEEWLNKKTKLYTSVIPGVMDSIELDDMRKLLDLVRAYREANTVYADKTNWDNPYPQYPKDQTNFMGQGNKGYKLARDAEEKAEKIVEGGK